MFCENKIKSELHLGEASQELLDWAKDNIGEDPDTKCQIISDFRDMIYSKGECAPHRTDDAFLLRFLRARRFKVERAHKLFVNYYDFKESNPEFFENVSLDQLEKIGSKDIITVPPYREQSGRRLLLYRIGNWDPEKYTIEDVFQATMMILELAILEEQAQILGGICIIDLGELSVQQTWYMNPSIAHKIVQIMVTSFPMKVHALHIVNQPWMFDMIYNLFKPFIDERMKKRVFFHGENMESLHQHINPKHLPKKYGGIQPDYNYNDWIIGFRNNKTIRKELESLGYNVYENDN